MILVPPTVNHAREAKHGEASILELGQLVASPGSGILAKVEGVKAKIAGGTAGAEHLAAPHLEVVAEQLDATNRSEYLPQPTGRHLEKCLRSNGIRLPESIHRHLARPVQDPGQK